MPFPTDTAKLPELMQQAIEWLVLLRSGKISEAETHAFADWLSQDIVHAQTFAKAEDLFNDAAIAAQTPRLTAPAHADSSEANKLIPLLVRRPTEVPVVQGSPERVEELKGLPSQKTQSNPTVKPSKATRRYPSARYFRWLAVPLALAAAWLFAVALILPEQSHLLDDYLSDYHTGTDELRDIRLADGSHLLLDTNTAVSVDYSESLRRITLHHGQAQFTVAKDTNRPFEVASGGLAIRALGTIFDVYNPGLGDMSVTVQEHAVLTRIQDKNLIGKNTRQPQVEIKEGQRLHYAYTAHLNKPEPVNLVQSSA